MGTTNKNNSYLSERIRETIERPPPGVDPWKGKEILGVLDRAERGASEHGAFYAAFMEHALDLVDDHRVERLLERFARHNLRVEARIHGDSLKDRDHLTHVCQVFLIGWTVLNSCRLFRFADDWSPYGWTCDAKERFERLNRAWLVCAFLHDSAYSVEKAREAREHEVAVWSLFGRFYDPGTQGALALEQIKERAEVLWGKRSDWIGQPGTHRRKDISAKLNDIFEEYRDHGALGGLALWEEAERIGDPALESILCPAAVGIGTHNFAHSVRPSEPPNTPVNLWFGLDLRTEPLGALLALCDEFQEWGRERTDTALSLEQEREVKRYAETELTHLELDDSCGLSLKLRLLRRLHPEDRAVRHRIAREQESALAKKTRQFEILFAPRDPNDAFRLHIEAEQTVDDIRCKNALRVAWPAEDRGLLESLDAAWREKPANAVERRFTPISLECPEGEDSPGFTLSLAESGTCRLSLTDKRKKGLRQVITSPGGTGKSTMLRQLAETGKDRRRPAARILYIEELSDALTDLGREAERLHENDSRDVLLLFDHLERLVEADDGRYWIEQLRSLPERPWLHVLCASRREEYDRYLRGQFGKAYAAVDLPVGGNLLTGCGDSRGRATAREVDRLLRRVSPERMRELARIAVGMGAARASRWPVAASGVLDDALFGEPPRPVLEWGLHGERRFAHDTVQDFFAALEIAHRLSQCASEGGYPASYVDALRVSPRDVTRLLFDILAARELRAIDARSASTAAKALAVGLFRRPEVQQRLYESGALAYAEEAIEAFDERRAPGSRIVRLVSQKLLGHIAFERFSTKKLDVCRERHAQHAIAASAVRHFAASARCAEDLLAEESDGPDASAARWMLAFAANHIAYTMLQLAAHGDSESEARALAREVAGLLFGGREPAPLHPGWLRRIVEEIAKAPGMRERQEVFESVHTGIERFVADSSDKVESLEVRRAILCGHLGNRLLDQGFSEVAERGELLRAVDWYHRSAAIRGRVLRRMRRSEADRSAEPFDSVSAGLGDAAHQRCRAFDALFLAWRLVPRTKRKERARLVMDMVEEHRAAEEGWRLAAARRETAERLPNIYRSSLAALALGKVLVRHLGAQATEEETLEKEIRKEAEKLLEKYTQLGARHARYKEGDKADTPENLFDHYPGELAGVVETLKEIIETFGEMSV